MLIPFSIYFILFCLVTMLFIVITSDTREMRAEDAERMEYINTILVLRVAPALAVVAAILIPTIIISGV